MSRAAMTRMCMVAVITFLALWKILHAAKVHSPGDSFVFDCPALCHLSENTTGPIRWEGVENKYIHELNNVTGRVIIPSLTLEMNGTRISCTGDYIGGEMCTGCVLILVEGLPPNISSLEATILSNSSIIVSWTAHPENLTYCVLVVNSSSGSQLSSECDIEVTEYLLPAVISQYLVCNALQVTVTSVGDHTANQTAEVALDTVSGNLTCQEDMSQGCQCLLQTTTSACSISSVAINNITGTEISLPVEMGNAGSNSHIVSCGDLKPRQLYIVELTVTNSGGNSTIRTIFLRRIPSADSTTDDVNTTTDGDRAVEESSNILIVIVVVVVVVVLAIALIVACCYRCCNKRTNNATGSPSPVQQEESAPAPEEAETELNQAAVTEESPSCRRRPVPSHCREANETCIEMPEQNGPADPTPLIFGTNGSLPGEEGSPPGEEGSLPGEEGSPPGEEGSPPGEEGLPPDEEGSPDGTTSAESSGGCPSLKTPSGITHRVLTNFDSTNLGAALSPAGHNSPACNAEDLRLELFPVHSPSISSMGMLSQNVPESNHPPSPVKCVATDDQQKSRCVYSSPSEAASLPCYMVVPGQ